MDIEKICNAILHAPLRLSDHDMSHYTLIKTVLEQTAEHVRREYDAATRSAAGPAAQGWRLLEVGETIQYGDEYHDAEEGEWHQHLAAVGEKIVNGDCVRRRLPAAPQDEQESGSAFAAMRAMVIESNDKILPVAPAVGDVGAVVEAAWEVYFKLVSDNMPQALTDYIDDYMADDVSKLGVALEQVKLIAAVTALSGKGGE